jgi:lipopolysaccharide transport system permease protein
MVVNAPIIRKIYFPRLIIPASSVLVTLFDFMMALVVFAGIMIYYGQSLDISAIVFFPMAIIMVILAAFGTSTLLAALNIKYRDFRYIVPFMLQLGFFATQIMYPLSMFKEGYLKNILAINPVNGAIELCRASLTGATPDWTVVYISSAAIILILLTGIFYFRKTEAYFADIA